MSWFSKAQNKEDWSTTPSTLPDTPAPDQLLSGSDGPKPLHAQIAQPPSSRRIIGVNGQCGSDANASQLTLLLAGGAARNRYSCDCQACTRSPVNDHFWQPQRMAGHTVVTLVSSLQTVYPSQRRVCPSPRDLDKRTQVRGFPERLHRVSGPKDAICGMKGTAREPREANQGKPDSVVCRQECGHFPTREAAPTQILLDAEDSLRGEADQRRTSEISLGGIPSALHHTRKDRLKLRRPLHHSVPRGRVAFLGRSILSPQDHIPRSSELVEA